MAFYRAKKRFHEQASSLGFSNGRLGSIMEWQVVQLAEPLLSWIFLKVVMPI